jgi:hypothetical protein
MKSKRIVLITSIVIVLVIGAAGFYLYSELRALMIRPDGSVSSQTKIEKINDNNYYQYLSDNTDRFTQIVDAYPASMDVTEEQRAIFISNYLKTCRTNTKINNYYLKDNLTQQEIRTKSALVSLISPINSGEKAMALFYATQTECNYVDSYSGLNQFVNKVGDGYDVYTIFFGGYGCVNMEHELSVFHISSTGKVTYKEGIGMEIGNGTKVCFNK